MKPKELNNEGLCIAVMLLLSDKRADFCTVMLLLSQISGQIFAWSCFFFNRYAGRFSFKEAQCSIRLSLVVGNINNESELNVSCPLGRHTKKSHNHAWHRPAKDSGNSHLLVQIHEVPLEVV